MTVTTEPLYLPPPIDPSEIVSGPEIAERVNAAGLTTCVPATVDSWRKRARTSVHRVPMPDPDGFTGGGRNPWWFWTATIKPWLELTGRI